MVSVRVLVKILFISFGLFLRFTDRELTFEEEQMLNALGVKL
jgi:hypothetical protein